MVWDLGLPGERWQDSRHPFSLPSKHQFLSITTAYVPSYTPPLVPYQKTVCVPSECPTGHHVLHAIWVQTYLLWLLPRGTTVSGSLPRSLIWKIDGSPPGHLLFNHSVSSPFSSDNCPNLYLLENLEFPNPDPAFLTPRDGCLAHVPLTKRRLSGWWGQGLCFPRQNLENIIWQRNLWHLYFLWTWLYSSIYSLPAYWNSGASR